MGTPPDYMVASAVYRLTSPPVVGGSVAMLYGYFRSMLRGVPRYGDDEFQKFLRRYQWACLLRGKAAALAELNLRQGARWNPDRP